MKKFFLFLLLIIFGNAFGNANFNTNDKIAFINISKIFFKSTLRAAISKKLENEFFPKILELQSIENNINKQIKLLEKNNSTMTSKERNNLKNLITKQQEKFSEKLNFFEISNNIRQIEERNKILNKIQKVTQKLAIKNGYNVIFNTDNVIYFQKIKDLTDKVLKEIDF